MHEHQDMKEGNGTLQFPHHTGSHGISASDTLWSRDASPHQGVGEGVSSRTAAQEQTPDPLISLPLAKTEPTGKEQVQNIIVIGFSQDIP